MGFAGPNHWLLNCSLLWQEHLHNSFPYATVLKSSSFSAAVLLTCTPHNSPSSSLSSSGLYFSLLSVLTWRGRVHFPGLTRCACWLVCWGDSSWTPSTQETQVSQVELLLRCWEPNKWLEIFYMASGCFFCRPIAQTYCFLNHPASSQVYFLGKGEGNWQSII